jgi:hypothetical protein
MKLGYGLVDLRNGDKIDLISLILDGKSLRRIRDRKYKPSPLIKKL